MPFIYVVPSLMAMISGDIDREEWRLTIAFYLELKAEEEEMHNQQADHAKLMKDLRAKKLEELGKGGSNRNANKVPPMATVETRPRDDEETGASTTARRSSYTTGLTGMPALDEESDVGMDIDEDSFKKSMAWM